MIDRDAWIAAFPYRDEAADAIAYICESWRHLANHQAPTFNADEYEPTLTEMLGIHLRSTSKFKGLPGRWGYENQSGRLRSGRAADRVRSDLEYWSNVYHPKPELELTIEFKRLDAEPGLRAKYYGKNGMGRFVYGEYSQRRPLAVMAAILIDETPRCIAALRRALHVKDIQLGLGMLEKDGVYLREPSALFPGSALFDTEHRRDVEKAPEHGAIRISHLFVEFPALPTRTIRKKKRRSSGVEDGT